jgi:hypothetical protein
MEYINNLIAHATAARDEKFPPSAACGAKAAHSFHVWGGGKYRCPGIYCDNRSTHAPHRVTLPGADWSCPGVPWPVKPCPNRAPHPSHKWGWSDGSDSRYECAGLVVGEKAPAKECLIHAGMSPTLAADRLGQTLPADELAKVLAELYNRQPGCWTLDTGMSPEQVAERLIAAIGQDAANNVAFKIYHAARGGSFAHGDRAGWTGVCERPEKCPCPAAGVWGAGSVMPRGHYWHWSDKAHTSGYLAHTTGY